MIYLERCPTHKFQLIRSQADDCRGEIKCPLRFCSERIADDDATPDKLGMSYLQGQTDDAMLTERRRNRQLTSCATA